MADTVQRRVRHRSPNCRKRRRQSDCAKVVKSDYGFYKAEDIALSCSTSSPSYASLDTSSSFVTHLESTSSSSDCLCLLGCHDSYIPPDLCNDPGSKEESYFPSSLKSPQRPQLRLPICTSDDEMNANSPDSGFESTTPLDTMGADYFDESLKSDTFDELSKASSFDSGSLKESPLCLVPLPKPEPPPVKKEPELLCKWKDCSCTFPNGGGLHEHLISKHIDQTENRFCCLWIGCKVYDKPSRHKSWLRQHVTSHTGDKRFKCIVGGCDASFTSQEGYQRHVSSHFNEVNFPKAKPNNHCERKYLVKRRKIKNQRKALANIHDSLDTRCMNVVMKSLVRYTSNAGLFSTPCETPQDEQVLGTRECKGGLRWKLVNNNTLTNKNSSIGESLFIGTPRQRCRKFKNVQVSADVVLPNLENQFSSSLQRNSTLRRCGNLLSMDDTRLMRDPLNLVDEKRFVPHLAHQSLLRWFKVCGRWINAKKADLLIPDANLKWNDRTSDETTVEAFTSHPTSDVCTFLTQSY